ncbi:GNAT family N-acetyltransferase [Methanoplanus sp. FWC-SCC4]|uniref:GNAT family N-acetyltransferase n=1 Tax=Methanochimaera problematica TaxID=2609417 RepID=A0AA97FCV5_9EURY|nr:GNAT family protein [Methanoplanus sp. FWC-SCC4]WOF17075.1 GNAT family N-acetyltransferase [Methanoplanus sp. FWC-SCC4]
MAIKYIGDKLQFSYIKEEDLPSVCRMLEKENVCKWLFFGPNTHETTREYFTPLIESVKKSLDAKEIPKNPVFTIKTKEEGHFVGQCALLQIDYSPGAFLLGYQIDDICWHRSYGTEACEFLVYYAFFIAEGYRINGDCVSENTGSWKVMQKCGFKKEGCQRNYWHYNDNYYDRALYGLLKEDLNEDMISYYKEKFSGV